MVQSCLCHNKLFTLSPSLTHQLREQIFVQTRYTYTKYIYNTYYAYSHTMQHWK